MNGRPFVSLSLLLAMVTLVTIPRTASANKIGWMDDMVRRVVKSSDPELAKPGRMSGRLIDDTAGESLSTMARRSDSIAHAGRSIDEATEAALEMRFARMLGSSDPELLRTFRVLEPAEKRLVLRMGEAAEQIARRYPDQADVLIRRLGVDGMTAVRVYGDDVAEVIAREGPEAINVLRRSGRPGWNFYVGTVLQHKRKLAAAGVLGLFLANPDRFVDSAGKITDFAVAKFAEAGIDLVAAVGSGAAQGLERSLSDKFGLGGPVLRGAIMIGTGFSAAIALLVVIGLPVRWITSPLRLLGRGLRATVRSS